MCNIERCGNTEVIQGTSHVLHSKLQQLDLPLHNYRLPPLHALTLVYNTTYKDGSVPGPVALSLFSLLEDEKGLIH